MGAKPIPAPVVHAGPGAPLCFLNGMRQLLERALDIQQRYWSATAQVYAAAVARDLEYVVRTHPALSVSRPMGWFASAVGCLSKLGADDSLLRPLAAAFSREQNTPRRWTPATVDRWARAMAGACQHGRPGFLAVARMAIANPGADLVTALQARARRGSETWLNDLMARGVVTQRVAHGLSAPREHFVPELEDVAAVTRRFRPSLAMVAALAEAGAFDEGRRRVAQLAPRRQAPALGWLALYAHRRGHARLFRSLLASVGVDGHRDSVSSVVALDAARRADFDEADRWVRSVQGTTARAAAAARVGLLVDAMWDERRARGYLRRAFDCATPSPEAWALTARVVAVRSPKKAPEGIARAVAALEQRRRHYKAPRVEPPLRPEPSSAGLVLREALGLWERTRRSRVLERLGPMWACELKAQPQLLEPLLTQTSPEHIRRLVNVFPQNLRPAVGPALEARATRAEALALDAGQALAGIHQDAPANADAMAVLGALLGPAWSGRPAGGPLRVAFDEGASLAPGSKATSRLLARSARRWVEDGMVPAASPDQQQRGEAGLRILVNLRGTREKELLGGWVEDGPEGPMQGALVDALVKLWPRKALALLWERFLGLSDGGAAALKRFELLEAMSVAEKGFGRAWSTVQKRLIERGVADPARWWDALARGWWRRYGRPMPVPGVRVLANRVMRSPEATLEDFVTLGPPAGMRSPLRVAAALADSQDELIRWLCLSESAIPGRSQQWVWWRELLEAAQKVPSVNAPELDEMAAALGKKNHEGRRWMLPRLGFETPVELETGILRLLDARRDVLAYLTAADSVPCCLTVSGRPLDWQAHRMALLWRDPLSMVFQLEQQISGQRAATGFVFGSLGWSARRPVVLLNGVYLKRSKAALRVEVLRAIEEKWARPLGVEGVGIAALHGGAGPLPEDYQRRDVRVRRACGLAGPLDLYDDTGLNTREPEVVRHLYWKVWGAIDER